MVCEVIYDWRHGDTTLQPRFAMRDACSELCAVSSIAYRLSHRKCTVKTTAAQIHTETFPSRPFVTTKSDRVKRAGVRHRRAHLRMGCVGAGARQAAVVIGHEFAGEVVHVAARHRRARERTRRPKGTSWTAAASSAAPATPRPRTPNHRRDRDVLAEYIAMPATNVWHLDDTVSFDVGSIHDPMGNAFTPRSPPTFRERRSS